MAASAAHSKVVIPLLFFVAVHIVCRGLCLFLIFDIHVDLCVLSSFAIISLSKTGAVVFLLLHSSFYVCSGTCVCLRSNVYSLRYSELVYNL